MRRRLVTIGAAFALVLAVLLTYEVVEFWRVDKCLDRGGRYNYEARACEFH